MVPSTLQHAPPHAPPHVPSAPRRRRADRSEQAIRDAGLRLMASEGLDAVSVARICREAKVANGTFYNIYPSKEAMSETLALEGAAELGSRLWVGRPMGSAASEAGQRRDVEIIARFAIEHRDLFLVAFSSAGNAMARRVTETLIAQRAQVFAEEFGDLADDLARAETMITQGFIERALRSEKPDEEALVGSLVTMRMALVTGARRRLDER